MNVHAKFSSVTKLSCYISLALVFWTLLASTGRAQILNLTSGNSSVSINTASSAGMYSWMVDGQNQLNQQWFWYRIGSSGSEAALNTVSAPVINQLSASIAQTSYANSLFQATILYSLVGGAPGSGASDLSEQISIQNLSGASLSFHFFQYADFNLGGTPNDDSGQLDPFGRMYGGVIQYNGYGCQVSENVDTAVSRAANHAQIGNGNTILNSLLDGSATTFNGNTATGGNINWGLEWDVAIASGGTLIISKDLNMTGVVPVETVPEPSAWPVVLLGLLSCGLYKRGFCCRTS
jgi:hypothetical protein